MASNIKLINIVFDLICFFLVFIVFLVVNILTYATDEGLYPAKRAFLCGDTSIQWPHKEESIPMEINDPLSFIIPIVVVSFHSVSIFQKFHVNPPFPELLNRLIQLYRLASLNEILKSVTIQMKLSYWLLPFCGAVCQFFNSLQKQI